MNKYEIDEETGEVLLNHSTISAEDVVDRLNDLEAKLAESEKSNEYFADRVEKADKEIKEIYKKYNKLVEEYNNLKEEVYNNFVDAQEYNELKQQLADTEAQNKRVLEKLELIVRDNQDLQKQLAESEKERELDNTFWKQECDSLQKALAEKEHSIEMLNQHLTDKAIEIEMLGEEIEELKTESMNIFEHSQKLEQQLAEKDKLLREKIGNMKSNEFIKMCIDCGFMVDAKEKHNQDKIELLEKVKSYFCEECEDGDGVKTGDWTITKDACEVAEYIDTLISEIKGE